METVLSRSDCAKINYCNALCKILCLTNISGGTNYRSSLYSGRFSPVSVCRLHFLYAGYTSCMQVTLSVCRLHFLCAGYTFCVQVTLPVCRLHFLCAGYTSCVLQVTLPSCSLQIELSPLQKLTATDSS